MKTLEGIFVLMSEEASTRIPFHDPELSFAERARDLVSRLTPAEKGQQMLHEAHELAQRIRRRRFKAGSLDLDFPEKNPTKAETTCP